MSDAGDTHPPLNGSISRHPSFYRGEDVILWGDVFADGYARARLVKTTETHKGDNAIRVSLKLACLLPHGQVEGALLEVQQCAEKKWRCCAEQLDIAPGGARAKSGGKQSAIMTLRLDSPLRASPDAIDGDSSERSAVHSRLRNAGARNRNGPESERQPQLQAPISATVTVTLERTRGKAPQRFRLAMPPLDEGQQFWLWTNIRPRLSVEHRRMLESMRDDQAMVVLYHFYQQQERALSLKNRRET